MYVEVLISLFRNEFNKFNYTGTQMVDSIYNMICYDYFEISFLA